MANPFTYSELHSKDQKKARAFYTSLFDWKLEPFDVPGRQYHMVDAREGQPGAITEELLEGISGWLTYVRVDDRAKTTGKARERRDPRRYLQRAARSGRRGGGGLPAAEALTFA